MRTFRETRLQVHRILVDGTIKPRLARSRAAEEDRVIYHVSKLRHAIWVIIVLASVADVMLALSCFSTVTSTCWEQMSFG